MRKFLLISICFFILVIIFTYPSILHLNDKLIGDGGDNYQYFSFQYIASQNIKNFHFPFAFTDIFRYPIGFNFGIGFDSVLNSLIGAFLAFFISNVLAFNLTVLILLFLNALLSYPFFYLITKKNAYLGMIGGIIYGFSSYALARSSGHINLIFIGPIPYFLYSLIKISRPSLKYRDILFFYFSILLIFFGSFQYSLLIAIGIVCVLPVFYFFYKKDLFDFLQNINVYRKAFFFISIPFLLLIFIFIFPYLKALSTSNFGVLNRLTSVGEFSPMLKDFILPNHFSRLLIGKWTNNLSSNIKSIEKVVFIGWPELVLFLGFLFSHYSRKLKLFFLALLTVFLMFSLGPTLTIFNINVPLPYLFVYDKFPFSYIPESGRFFILFYLIFTTTTILYLNELLSKRKLIVNLLLICLVTFILFERLPYQFWLSPTFTDKEYISYVKKNKGKAVFDIPADISFNTTTYDILPYLYNKKILSGYFHYLADTEASKKFLQDSLISRFICENKTNSSLQSSLFYQSQKISNASLLKKLKSNDIYTIVVHKNDLEDHAKYYFPECANVRMESSFLLPQLYILDPTKKLKILSVFFPAVPNEGDTITLPFDGAFYIDGIQAYPSNWLPLHLTIDDKEIVLNQNWKVHENMNATIEPFIKIDVKKGSKIKLSFDKNQNTDYSFVKIWYRYEADNTNILPITIDGITKVYEDNDAAVFYIN